MDKLLEKVKKASEVHVKSGKKRSAHSYIDGARFIIDELAIANSKIAELEGEVRKTNAQFVKLSKEYKELEANNAALDKQAMETAMESLMVGFGKAQAEVWKADIEKPLKETISRQALALEKCKEQRNKEINGRLFGGIDTRIMYIEKQDDQIEQILTSPNGQEK